MFNPEQTVKFPQKLGENSGKITGRILVMFCQRKSVGLGFTGPSFSAPTEPDVPGRLSDRSDSADFKNRGPIPQRIVVAGGMAGPLSPAPNTSLLGTRVDVRWRVSLTNNALRAM